MISQKSSLAKQTSSLLLKASVIAGQSDDPELKKFATGLAASALGFLDVAVLRSRKGVNNIEQEGIFELKIIDINPALYKGHQEIFI